MNEKTPLNRLNQPIPDKCPLSEAIVWLITECLPIDLDDYKSISTPSLNWYREKSPSSFLDESAPEYISASDSNGQIIEIDWGDFSAAKNKLLVAIRNKDIRAWGLYDDFHVEQPEKLERINQQITDIWDTSYKEVYLMQLLDNTINAVPANMWSWELVDWFENILHSPLSCDKYFQFSDVIISTKDLFEKFSDKNSTLNLQKKERFWIPISQGLSLILTGKHSSELSANNQIYYEKESELIRMLRNGKLSAEGYSGGNLEVIENTSWTSDSDLINNRIGHSYYDIHVDENEIRSLFEIPQIDETFLKASSTLTTSQSKLERRGAPSKYDWEEFFTEIIVLADLDSLPDLQADLEREMAAWCLDKWGKEPSPSTIRRKVNAIYNHPRKAGGSE